MSVTRVLSAYGVLLARRSSITIAISKVAGQAHGKTDALLRSSLSSISYFAQADKSDTAHVGPEFVAEVSSLIDRLNQVLKDTLEMRCVVVAWTGCCGTRGSG